MPTLRCEVSQSLLDALTARRERTGETTDHIVMSALADALQVEHSTLFQVSTAPALVEGVTRGAITVAELERHGDFGLGTFAGLDGEMVVVDGTTYQVTREGVRVAPPDGQVPFAVVTHFVAEASVSFSGLDSLDTLLGRLDGLRNTDNDFFAVRLEGHFERLKTRAVCKSDDASLVDAAAAQAKFEFRDTPGVIVGFWTPAYAVALNVRGWHLHFLSADRSGGGHLLGCRAATLRASVQHLADFRVALPETAAFLRADLARDASRDLAAAEQDH